MKVMAIIPARGGSKRFSRKNVKPLAGKPLIAHTIEHAQQAKSVNRVIVSTDNAEILDIAKQYQAEVILRPDEISGDTASSESALQHVLSTLRQNESYEPDLLVFLQCTSPIRHTEDIDLAVHTLLQQEADSLLSVVPAHVFLWRVIDGQIQSFNFDYRNRLRRQDMELEYHENGSIYVLHPWVLDKLNNRLGGKVAFYEMDSWSGIDIDSQQDFELCEWIMTRLS